MAKKGDIVVGLDVGTTKVCTVIVEQLEGGKLSAIGLGTTGSSGMKQGMVVSIDETVAAIEKSVAEAEEMAGVEVHTVIAGISGSHVRGINNRATVGVKGGEVTAADIDNVMDAARAIELSRDDEIVHVTPQRYILDSQDVIHNPIGMAGNLLSMEAHVVAAAGTATQNLLRCIQKAGIEVHNVVPQPLASAYAVLSPEEMELGAALVDIGGGTTDVAIFLNGSVRHTWVLPLGGNHITHDISQVLSTPIREAERIKVQFGEAVAERVGDDLIEVPSVGGRPNRQESRAYLAEIVEARMEEILTLVYAEIRRAGFAARIGSGLVFTGGGSLMPGIVNLATRTTGLMARRGGPVQLSGLTELASNPKHATAVGLAQCAVRGTTFQICEPTASGGLARIKGWFKEFF